MELKEALPTGGPTSSSLPRLITKVRNLRHRKRDHVPEAMLRATGGTRRESGCKPWPTARHYSVLAVLRVRGFPPTSY